MLNQYKKILLFVPIILTACGTTEVIKSANNETYSVSAQYALLAGGWERATFEAKDKATSFCGTTGKKIEFIEEKREGVAGLTLLSSIISFKCVVDSKQDSSANSATTVKNTMDEAKKQCVDLGFKTGTESFGQCVLKLTK